MVEPTVVCGRIAASFFALLLCGELCPDRSLIRNAHAQETVGGVGMSSKIKLYIIVFILFAALVAAASTIHIPHASQTTTNSNELGVAFMDIGQGDAILLTTPHNHHILI